VQGLESCKWFLVVVSQHSISSDWVKDELFWAIDKRPDNIIAVQIDDREPRQLHIRLARKQCVDLKNNPQEARLASLSLLGQHLLPGRQS